MGDCSEVKIRRKAYTNITGTTTLKFNSLLYRILTLHLRHYRLAGYGLFLFMLFVIHNGGAWSNWFNRNTDWINRFLAYVLGPIAVIVGMNARTRYT